MTTRGLLALGCAAVAGVALGACEAKKPWVPDPLDPSSMTMDGGATPPPGESTTSTPTAPTPASTTP